MARSRRSRTIAASPEAVWKVLADPYSMNRWWPGVERVEGVSDEHFTLVYRSKRGRSVRMDFNVLGSEPPGSTSAFAGRRMWEQDIEGTPFQRIFGESVTEVVLEAGSGESTVVTIEQRQKLKGYSRVGAMQVARAATRNLHVALDGLEQAVVAGDGKT